MIILLRFPLILLATEIIQDFLQGYSTVNKIVKCVVLVERRQVNTEPKGKQNPTNPNPNSGSCVN